MNQARRQAYLTLIESLFTCPSEEETAILEANLELLDDDFAEYLREWATETLPKLDADKAYNRANNLYCLNITFSSLQQGCVASNLEIAIACLDIGLTIFTREAYSGNWAMFQNSLGNKYCSRIKGDRGDNLERAIACYDLALLVRTRAAFPQQWAGTQNNLANAYSQRIREDRAENIEKAIACYNLALLVRTRAAFPQQWATTQNNLGEAYRKRIREDRAENIEKAIAAYNLALLVYTRADFPQDWAGTQNNLAIAYKDRIREDRAENIEKAIAAYNLALLVRTRAAFPQDWATTQNNLANAYTDRIRGDRSDNLEKAIAFYEAALSVYTRDAFPENWAITQNNLAIAYSDRIKGDRGDNLERAEDAYELALSVYTPGNFPEDWARTQYARGNSYLERIKGDKQNNLEKAIVFFESALQVYTREDFPEDWARTQKSLGLAYLDRIRGDKKENLNTAITVFTKALKIYTPTIYPFKSLEICRILGNLAFTESLWKKASYWYEKAIECVEEMRETETSESRKRKILEENIDVYEKMVQSCINCKQYDRALQTVDRSKSRYLVELFTNSEIYPKTATESEKQQLRNLRSQIAASQQFLERESSTPPLPPPLSKGGPGGVPEDSDTQRATQTRTLSPESFQQEKDNLAKALQQLEQLLKQIKKREPEFTLTQKVEPINIAEFQQTLDTETAIVEWYIGNPKFNNQDWGGSAFIITRDKIDLVPITATELAELETWKNDYLNEYRDKAKQKIWQQTLSAKLHKLSEILRLDEIVAKIPNHCHQLILVPHRYLHLFPLHALPFTSQTRFTQETMLFRGNLLDCFPSGVKYAPSLQLLELVQNRIKTRTSPAPELQPLFAIQNPTEDLSNADMEVQIIKQKFDTHDILIKQQATKIAFNENLKNLSNASYIHFSCHGVFNFDYPLLSLLALADSIESIPEINPPQIPEINPPQPPLGKGGLEEEINPPQPPLGKGGLEERGLESPRYVTMRSGRKAIPEKCLTLREIFADLELSKCNLVTLSACETGLTSSTEMTDEYIGLPSGFLYAGSLSVVSTLWSVDDFATAILMIKFYQELQSEVSVAVALNCAQNWMRAVSKEDLGVWVKSLSLDKKSGQSVELWLVLSPDERPFSHPKYWAAFCATGY